MQRESTEAGPQSGGEEPGNFPSPNFQNNVWFLPKATSSYPFASPGVWNWLFAINLFVEIIFLLVSKLVKWNLTTVAPLGKNTFGHLQENPLSLLPWKRSFRRPWSEMIKKQFIKDYPCKNSINKLTWRTWSFTNKSTTSFHCLHFDVRQRFVAEHP